MLHVDLERSNRRSHVVARQGDTGIGKPHEIARIALHARRLGKVAQHETLVLRIKLGRESVKDCVDVRFVGGVFRNVLPIEGKDAFLHLKHARQITRVDKTLDSRRHSAHRHVNPKRPEEPLVDDVRHGTAVLACLPSMFDGLALNTRRLSKLLKRQREHANLFLISHRQRFDVLTCNAQQGARLNVVEATIVDKELDCSSRTRTSLNLIEEDERFAWHQRGSRVSGETHDDCLGVEVPVKDCPGARRLNKVDLKKDVIVTLGKSANRKRLADLARPIEQQRPVRRAGFPGLKFLHKPAFNCHLIDRQSYQVYDVLRRILAYSNTSLRRFWRSNTVFVRRFSVFTLCLCDVFEALALHPCDVFRIEPHRGRGIFEAPAAQTESPLILHQPSACLAGYARYRLIHEVSGRQMRRALL